MSRVVFSSMRFLAAVVVHSGFYNKIAQTEQLINNRNLFFNVLEAGRAQSGCQHGGVSVPFLAVDFWVYPHTVEGARELTGVSF